jgi:predicted glutamine amidotransferase
MCKVAAVPRVTDKNRDEVWAFMQVLGEYMSYGNNHGLGYAAFDSKHNLFGERWLYNKRAFYNFPQKPDNSYHLFGRLAREEAKAIILHTRYATCEKGIENTHPFVDDEQDPTVAIIHNGVITNDEEFEKKYGTCDSEVLAHLYAKHEIANSLSNLKEVTKKIAGWYTVLNLSKDALDRPIFDIYTQNGRLHSLFIPELDTRIYSTSIVDIEATAEFMGMTCTLPTEAKKCHAYRIDALTGEPMERIEFEEKPWTSVYSAEGNFDDPNYWEDWWLKNGAKLDV